MKVVYCIKYLLLKKEICRIAKVKWTLRCRTVGGGEWRVRRRRRRRSYKGTNKLFWGRPKHLRRR
jgi:hypothetical protein